MMSLTRQFRKSEGKGKKRQNNKKKNYIVRNCYKELQLMAQTYHSICRHTVQKKYINENPWLFTSMSVRMNFHLTV